MTHNAHKPTTSSNGDFEIIFGQDTHDIESVTLTSYLLNFSNLVQEVNQVMHPGTKLKIRIKAFAPGSFKVACGVEKVDYAGAMLPMDPEEKSASDVLDTSHELMDLRKHIGMEKPQEIIDDGKSVKIINPKGEVKFVRTQTYRMFTNNKSIDSSMQKQFEAVATDENIGSVAHVNKNKDVLFEANRQDLEILKGASPLSNDDKIETKIHQSVTVIVFKPVFERGYKWGIIYQNKKIYIDVLDESLYDEIDSGIRFGKGDRLLIDLKEIREFDEILQEQVIREADYAIVKYHRYIPRPKQMVLDS